MSTNADLSRSELIWIFYTLLELKEPVSLRLLAKLTGTPESKLLPVLEAWNGYHLINVQIIDKEPRYSIEIHDPSFKEYLQEMAKMVGVDLKEVNRRIGDSLAQGAPL